MKSSIFLFLFLFIAVLVSFKSSKPNMGFEIPKGWPDPLYYFKGNEFTEDKFQLGRKLFYDPILSRDSSISCSSCHVSFSAFAHTDHALSHGIDGRVGRRNAPALINMAWNPYFHWDGSLGNIERQSMEPIRNHNEMDFNLDSAVSRLLRNKFYNGLFEKAWGDSEITVRRMLQSLAIFTSNLVSSNSKYDKIMRKERGVAFTNQEKNGYILFKKNCASCHKEPLFSTYKLKSNGLPIDLELKDYGHYTISEYYKDSFLFKVPTLRNIEFTFPYMHDGRFKKLKDVLKHYAELNPKTPYLSKELRKIKPLSSNDQKDIIAFLLTLTDKEFLYNPRYQFPR
ncbi:MAG: c-type cytochrome [Bacteroidetes bacterium]|nr:c-type cytochrome [Bacteroidota bacterium]